MKYRASEKLRNSYTTIECVELIIKLKRKLPLGEGFVPPFQLGFAYYILSCQPLKNQQYGI